jgi:hypothetical protein
MGLLMVLLLLRFSPSAAVAAAAAAAVAAVKEERSGGWWWCRRSYGGARGLLRRGEGEEAKGRKAATSSAREEMGVGPWVGPEKRGESLLGEVLSVGKKEKRRRRNWLGGREGGREGGGSLTLAVGLVGLPALPGIGLEGFTCSDRGEEKSRSWVSEYMCKCRVRSIFCEQNVPTAAQSNWCCKASAATSLGNKLLVTLLLMLLLLLTPLLCILPEAKRASSSSLPFRTAVAAPSCCCCSPDCAGRDCGGGGGWGGDAGASPRASS